MSIERFVTAKRTDDRLLHVQYKQLDNMYHLPILITDFSKMLVKLPKNMLIAAVTKPTETITAFDPLLSSSSIEVNAVYLIEPRANMESNFAK